MATGTLVRKTESSGTYSYSSQPRLVQQRRKYRDLDGRPSNIMHDRRIVRGNTYALHSLPASSQPNPLELQRQQESRRRLLARKRVNEQMRIHSPPPVEGRKHIDIQTELYLEEITDRVEEADVHTQTDAFLDRPPTPMFIPAKTGVDVATQIEDGDLFDFDLEVKPILEVLVGKTVEQALLEVMEEEELSALREQQRIFEENRNSEVVETQRLEEQERRRREEKERRMQQQREALLKEKETADKVSARAFAQSYLSDLVPAVFSCLSESGFFYDPVERDIETSFIPWLMEETEKLMDKKITARILLDAIIRSVVKKKLGTVDTPPEVVNVIEDDETTGETDTKTSEDLPMEPETSQETESSVTSEKPRNEEKPTEELIKTEKEMEELVKEEQTTEEVKDNIEETIPKDAEVKDPPSEVKDQEDETKDTSSKEDEMKEPPPTEEIPSQEDEGKDPPLKEDEDK